MNRPKIEFITYTCIYIISQISIFNLVHVLCHTNVSKQTTLSDGVDGGPPKWQVCGRGLNPSVHKISNVRVHFKTHSGNVKYIGDKRFRMP